MPKRTINSWIEGLNTLSDARRLPPNTEKETIGGSVVADNVSITKNGQLITSTGYEIVSEIAGSGGAKFLMDYNKNQTDRYLLITHGTKHYSITPANTAWSETVLGTYGSEAALVGGTVYRSAAGTRKAIIGNDISGNNTQKADLSGAMADAGAGAPDGYVMTTFMGRLFTASGKVLSYSSPDDETVLGGTIGFNDDTTALKVEGERLIVFTRSYHQGVVFEYDGTFVLSVPLKDPYERQYGCLSHRGMHIKDSAAVYHAKEGFYQLGAESGYNEQGLPRSQSFSNKIDPSLKYINFDYANKGCSIYDPINKESLWAVPYSPAQYNNKIFVYNWNFGSWTTRSGLYPTDFALFKASADTKDSIYFTDHFNPRLLRFNNEYSYGGDGYIRRWKSKIFTMGADMNMKKFNYVNITGSIYTNTEFTVKLIVDNEEKHFTINGDYLVKNKYDNYLGDNWIGDEWLGGTPAPESKFYRFKSKLQFPIEIKSGFELQIEITNSAAQQPWKIDSIEVDFDYLPDKRLPSKYMNNDLSVTP